MHWVAVGQRFMIDSLMKIFGKLKRLPTFMPYLGYSAPNHAHHRTFDVKLNLGPTFYVLAH